MSLSGLMTFSESGGDWENADPGSYVCRLKEVEKGESPDFNDPSKMKPNLMWRFETTKNFDSQDRPFRFTYFTGTAYGNDKAKLTGLINGMMGRALTREEFATLAADMEPLLEREWMVLVDEHVNKSGKTVNVIRSVRPVKKRRVEVVEEDVEDPFAE